MADQIEFKVKQLVANVFGLPFATINTESSQETISNWDSLNIINLMIAIESEFGITMEVDDAVKLISVRAIIELLSKNGVS
jgi:acyl carrier protein